MATKKVTMKATKVTKATKAVAKKKVVKKAAPKKKVVAKKVTKKPVAKKKTAKETLKEKYTKLYKIVSNYSESLMQDVYSVVYRTKTLKRFINENLCKAYIEQEVLLRVAEHSMKESKKTKALKMELESEFA